MVAEDLELLAAPQAEQESTLEAWYMDDSTDNQRLPHRRTPNKPYSLSQLRQLGILSWKLDADIYENDPKLEAIRKVRGYSYQDVMTASPEKLDCFEQKLKMFYEEHIHSDEEIRYCLEGSGYFDVRNQNDEWIRIQVRKGDMIVLPAGMYHRFTMDENNYMKAMRLFVGEPVWTPHNRPQEEHPARKWYVQNFVKIAAQA